MTSGPVDVWFMERADRATGFVWPRDHNGQFASVTAIEDPHEVVIHLADGRVLRSGGRLLLLNLSSEGVLRNLKLNLSRDVISFERAVAEVEQASVRFGISLDERSRADLKRWPTLRPDPQDVLTGPFIARGISFGGGAIPELIIEAHAGRNGFFVTFQLTQDAPL